MVGDGHALAATVTAAVVAARPLAKGPHARAAAGTVTPTTSPATNPIKRNRTTQARTPTTPRSPRSPAKRANPARAANAANAADAEAADANPAAGKVVAKAATLAMTRPVARLLAVIRGNKVSRRLNLAIYEL